MNKIVMALSGGMDSATMLGLLLAQDHQVECMSFTYGSKHNLYENEAAQQIAAHYRVPIIPVNLTGVMTTFKSNLLKTGEAIPEGHYNNKSMEQTVVPGRNLIFFAILTGHAWSIGAQQIALGIHRGDHATYADCRKEFFKAVDSAIYLGTDRRIEVIAPLLDWDKTGILRLGIPLHIPYVLTRTCYKNQLLACGKCGSCIERLEAFANLGIADPIQYEAQ